MTRYYSRAEERTSWFTVYNKKKKTTESSQTQGLVVLEEMTSLT